MVDIESLLPDNCLQPKILSCYPSALIRRSLPSTRAFICVSYRCITDKGSVDDLWRCDGNLHILGFLSDNAGTVYEVKDYEENRERTRDGDLPYQTRGLGV